MHFRGGGLRAKGADEEVRQQVELAVVYHNRVYVLIQSSLSSIQPRPAPSPRSGRRLRRRTRPRSGGRPARRAPPRCGVRGSRTAAGPPRASSALNMRVEFCVGGWFRRRLALFLRALPEYLYIYLKTNVPGNPARRSAAPDHPSTGYHSAPLQLPAPPPPQSRPVACPPPEAARAARRPPRPAPMPPPRRPARRHRAAPHRRAGPAVATCGGPIGRSTRGRARRSGQRPRAARYEGMRTYDAGG